MTAAGTVSCLKVLSARFSGLLHTGLDVSQGGDVTRAEIQAKEKQALDWAGRDPERHGFFPREGGQECDT